MEYEEKQDWDDRALKQYTYKNELFYTITAVPYYYKRRQVILKLLQKEIEQNGVQSICDYGCGDGEYLRKLYADASHKGIMWMGYDISQGMVRRARDICKDCRNIEFEIAERGIPDESHYDLIYSVAVLAHIEDNVCRDIMNSFAEHISDGGRIILCEQVGKIPSGGKTYVRRTVDEYIDLVQRAGLCVEKQYLIDFWAHRIFFERRIAKRIYKHMKAVNDFDRRIEANTHVGFRLLSAFFTFISKPHIFQDGKGWGYVFLVIKK